MSKFKRILKEPEDEFLIRDDYVTKASKKTLIDEPEDAKLVNEIATYLKLPEYRLALTELHNKFRIDKGINSDGTDQDAMVIVRNLSRELNEEMLKAGMSIDRTDTLGKLTATLIDMAKKTEAEVNSITDLPKVIFKDNPEEIETCLQFNFNRLHTMQPEVLHKYQILYSAIFNQCLGIETELECTVAEYQAIYDKRYDAVLLDFKNDYDKKGWSKKVTYIQAKARSLLRQDSINEKGIGKELDEAKLRLKRAKSVRTIYQHICNSLWKIAEFKKNFKNLIYSG